MTVTGTVASSNAPPDKPDDVDVNPARVRHEKDPVNLEQTAFVSSLVRAPPEAAATAPGPGPGPAGVHLVAPNGVGSRVDAGETSTETDAGQAGPGPTGAADGVVGSVTAGKRKAEGDPCSAGASDGAAVDGGVAGPAMDPGGAPSVSAVES